MATYELRVAASAERSLARLPEFAAAAIVEFLTGPLVESPRRLEKPPSFQLTGLYSVRRGPYRVIYRIEKERFVEMVHIDHQADVYRTR
ncbi:MAG: type II toxin-antitoxin system RelE/ParE family toxin [Coriobacteriia bacterium]